MGAWGTAVFDGDLASDVRAEWRQALVDGLTSEETTVRLEASFSDALEDVEDGPIFWLALAAAQFETGRLLPPVRDRALAIIRAGGDVARWAEDDESLGRRRQRVLERLAEQLRGPQRKPSTPRRPRSHAVSFDVGDVVHVRNTERDREALLLVVDQRAGSVRGAEDPVLAALAWDGGPIPSEAELERLPFVLTDEPGGREPLRPHLTVASTHRKDSVFGPHIGRVVAKGIERESPGDHRNGATWRGEVVTSYTEWPNVVAWVGGPAFRRELELTRAHAPGT